MPLSCQDGDRSGWHHTIARFTPVSIAGELVSSTSTPSRFELLGQPVGDLPSQPLLNLEAARAVVDDPGNLAQAQDALAWHITNVSDPGERQDVVLAHGHEADVPARAPGSGGRR